MKDTNAATPGERKRNRTDSTGGDGEIWISNIRSDGSEGARERGDKFSGGKRGKNRNVSNGIFRGTDKKKSKGGI